MTRFPWSSKDGHGDTDIGDSNVNGRPSPQLTRLNEWSTSRRELWCFYLYFVVRFFLFYFFLRTSFTIFYRRPKGNNGLSGFKFGPSQFQNLLYLAGYDPSQPPFAKPCGSGTDCVLPYMGRVRNSPSFLPRPSCRVAHQ
jgi:hypothetical protein